MTQRTRKFLGIIASVTFLLVYVLLAMAIGSTYFAEQSGLAQFVYYIIAGVGWLPFVMAIIKWMERPDEPD